ncbi:hypothetical protein J2X20_005034 [Pelomonas saccharophila]|uniref:Uncharacterized protein n=1 Tax=Roseateles saccharophilus TaxID=304 RepID=A0ABU1YVX3_ROSSA|nr:hypothetical protein [Roseateles saccharophilus]MDR7272360.1 hypothetical protein [Roseateles saccharophilus]
MRRHSLRFAAALLAACLSPMALAVTPLQHADLSCQFQATPRPDGQVSLQFKLSNNGKRDLHLLRWGSPFEGGWFGPFVKASTAQGELAFQGAMRKRGDPSAQDYLSLPAGQSLTASLTLNDAFTLPPTGKLRLKARWHWHDMMLRGTPPRPRAQHRGLDQDCGEVTLTR